MNSASTVSTAPPVTEKRALVALLRGVNVGSGNPMRMEALRAVCGSLGLEDTITYVQSGNAIFLTKETDLDEINSELVAAIKTQFGFEVPVVLRTIADLEAIVANNPFAGRTDVDPSRLIVTFLFQDPGDEGREKARVAELCGEELFAIGRETYVYYVNGVGKTQLKERVLNKALGTTGTGRNWNTVVKLLEMAKGLEATSKPK